MSQCVNWKEYQDIMKHKQMLREEFCEEN